MSEPEDILATAYALQISYDPDSPDLDYINFSVTTLQDKAQKYDRKTWETEIRISRKRKRSVECHETITVISRKDIDLMSEAQLVYFPMKYNETINYYPLDAVTDVDALLSMNLNPFTNESLTKEETNFLENAKAQHKYPRIEVGDFFEEIDEHFGHQTIYIEKEYQRKMRHLVTLIEQTNVIVYESAQIYNFETICLLDQYNLFLRHQPINQKISECSRDDASAITLNHIINYLTLQEEQTVALVSIAYAIDEFMYMISHSLTYDELLRERGIANELYWQPNFVVDDHYYDGTLKISYQIDEDHLKHGFYRRWYNNGTLCYRSKYTHGLESEIVHYYGTGEVFFENGIYYYPNHVEMAIPKDNEEFNLYDDSGRKIGSGILNKTNREISFIHNNKLGGTVYFTDNLITSVQIFENDHLHGVYIIWSKKGYLKSQWNYLVSQMHGSYDIWYTNGILKTHGIFEYDKKVGLWQEWYKNGPAKSEIWYEEGNKHGSEIYYYESGIQSKCEYENNKRIGIYQIFHKNGVLSEESYFYDGIQQGICIEWNDKGSVISSGLYLNNQQTGIWITWNHQIKTSMEYSYGSKVGPWKSIMNDIILYEGNYQDNKFHGLQTKYYPNGELCFQGHYDNGEPKGPWVYMYPNGQLGASG
ncbi:MAG: toxin-antitoxin system YwqK family antitoxin, partial [Rhizomicrobium sp.]